MTYQDKESNDGQATPDNKEHAVIHPSQTQLEGVHDEMPVAEMDYGSKWSWALITLVALLSMFQMLLASIGTAIAMPEIGRAFGRDPAECQWILCAPALTSSCCMLVAGRLSDVFGRKRIFVAGAAICFVSQLISGFMPNVAGLAAAQGLAGVGASLVIPSGLGMISVCVPPGRYQAYAFAAISAGAPMGAGTGAITCGALISRGAGWSSFFYFVAGISALPLALGWLLLPNDHHNIRKQRIDWIGAAYISAALFLLVFSFSTSQTSSKGWSAPYIGPCLAVGVLLIGIFIRRQHKLSGGTEADQASVLVPLRLFTRGRGTLSVLYASAFLIDFGSNPAWVLFSYYWIRHHHLPAVQAGYRYCAGPISGTLSCIIVGILQTRISARALLCTGCAMSIVSYILMGTIDPTWGYWRAEWLAMSWGVVAIDTHYSIASALVSDILDVEEQGVAQGLLSTFRRVGGALGFAVSVVITSSFERKALRHPAETTRTMADVDRAVLKGLQAGFWSAAITLIASLVVMLLGLRHMGVAGRRAEIAARLARAE